MGKAVCSDSERLKTFRTSENSKQAKSADTALWRGPISQRRQRERAQLIMGIMEW